MANKTIRPLPQSVFPLVEPSSGKPTLQFAQYLADLDAAVRQLLGGTPNSLTNAANDAAAAAAGVQVGQFYRAGSTVLIRVK